MFSALRRSRNLVANLLRVAISLFALAVLFRQVGGGAVFQELRRANWALLLLAWGLFLTGEVVRAFRWRALLQGLGLRPPFFLLLKLYFIGGFFNTFLPSGFGGDVIRVLELGREGDSPAALGTVLVDRMTGILSLMMLGLIVLPFAHGLVLWVRWLFLAIALGGLVAGGLVLQGSVVRRLFVALPGKLSLTGEGPVARIFAAVTGCGTRALLQALALSTLFNLLNIAVYWLCASTVGMDLNLAFYFVLVPLLSLTLIVPISVGGLGARDWVAQMLLAPTAVPDARIAAWTLSVWTVTAAAGLVGGLLYLWQGIAGLTRRMGDRGQGTGDRL